MRFGMQPDARVFDLIFIVRGWGRRSMSTSQNLIQAKSNLVSRDRGLGDARATYGGLRTGTAVDRENRLIVSPPYRRRWDCSHILVPRQNTMSAITALLFLLETRISDG